MVRLNNVGQASQTVAQHYISIGPMYRVIWVVAFLATGGESVKGVKIYKTPYILLLTSHFMFGTFQGLKSSAGELWGKGCT